MYPTNQRLITSQNNIRFSLKPPSKNKTTLFSPVQKCRDDQGTSYIQMMRQNMPKTEIRTSLPMVEQKNSNPKNCFAVDLLQLANSYSKCNIPSSNKLNLKYKDSSSNPSSSTTQQHQTFDVSINSAPETYLKQNRRSISKPPCTTPGVKNGPEQLNFAKSWPLAPIEHNSQASRLPQISVSRLNDEMRPNTNSFRGGFAKFNQSRAFRMKHSMPLDDANKTVNNSHKSPMPPNANGQTPNQECDECNHITIETVTELKITGSCKKLVCIDCKQPQKWSKPEISSSKESVLTHETSESVKVHPDAEEDNYEDEESKELDRKCMKWLEDVARERNQNPEKVFLPHLLMS